MKKCISNGIEEYLKQNNVPWHMPGHKRKACFDSNEGIGKMLNDVMTYDMTEVPGTDDLHDPEDFIKQSQEELAKVYNSFASYYLVNGATGGILAAIKAAADITGSKGIIMAKNCHKSVYNAKALLKLDGIYVTPRWKDAEIETSLANICGVICARDIEKALSENCDCKIVVLTSPTYEGVISDIVSIKKVCDKHNALLIVDEAHGAHLNFTYLKEVSAIGCKADFVVQSLHKTLSAMTQTAILHISKEEYVNPTREALGIFMTSSPSYIMMYSMENAIDDAEKTDYAAYLRRVNKFRSKVANLSNVSLLEKEQVISAGAKEYDSSRLVIKAKKLTGSLLARLLYKQNKTVVEMSGLDYVVLISTPKDDDSDFDRLFCVLEEIDEICENMSADFMIEDNTEENEKKGDNNTSTIEHIRKMVGSIAKENVFVYPPGSYIFIKGEEITKQAVDELIELSESGLKIRGLNL